MCDGIAIRVEVSPIAVEVRGGDQSFWLTLGMACKKEIRVGQEVGMGDSMGDVWQRSLFMLVHEKHKNLNF